MKIVFFTNFINHHQVHVADELYNSAGVEYTFVATTPIPDSFRKAGYPDYSKRPYLLNAYESENKKQEALKLAYEADVVIIGSAPEEYVTRRIKADKLTFRYNERWFKSKPWYLSGPRAWYSFVINHICYRNKPLYMLAASAYTINDVYAIGAYKDKVFKWGYFTKVDQFDLKESLIAKRDKKIRFMWCSRFLDWKHPELSVLLAKKLREAGYDFRIDMFGSGEQEAKIKQLIQELDVADVVVLRGNLPNKEILNEMRNHHIFLFTSDRNEGWGAVLNEAMSSGCTVMSSNLIGATPFLVQDGENGFIFESENIDSLFSKACLLMQDQTLREELACNAYKTMQEVWCPKNATKQLLNLIEALQKNNLSLIPQIGPCSKASRI